MPLFKAASAGATLGVHPVHVGLWKLTKPIEIAPGGVMHAAVTHQFALVAVFEPIVALVVAVVTIARSDTGGRRF